MEACALIAASICYDLADNCPNARDYYVQNENAFKQATEDHVNRLERLESVHKELMELADYVCEQELRRR